MKARQFLFLITMLLVHPAAVHSKAPVDGEYSDGLRQLDAILAQKSIYEEHFLEKVDMLKSLLALKNDSLHIYDLDRRVAYEYSSYSMDSTLVYLAGCRKAAEALGDRERVLETDIAVAEEYTKAGYHLEASGILSGIDAADLPKRLLLPYYTARHNLSGELLAYATDPVIISEQDSLRTFYRDRLLEITAEGTFEWHRLKREEAVQYGNGQEALEHSAEMVRMSEDGTHNYAIACYLYQELLDDSEKAEKINWCIKAACADIQCSTKDYAALNDLSEFLFHEGDIERAFSYSADHCMPDAIFFGGKLRPWQIAGFFPEIGKAYQDKNGQWQRKMNSMLSVMLVFILVLAFLSMHIYRRQRVLVRTRKALQDSYMEIERQNSDLLEANRKLSGLNSKILESDKVKQEYIALFLGILSENISTTRQYKNHVLKYIRHGNGKELAAEIEALPPIDEDISEFYKMFDHTFLNLYPDFVDKFNSLLADGEAIVTRNGDSLTPELRVFALIKLGITDSSKIASLLHYSANTIYNYRSKIKNKAKGDRSGFEDAVKMI